MLGVDGSEHSERAVRWCADHARAFDAEVIVVHAIELPVYAGFGAAWYPAPPLSEAQQKKILEVMSAEWCKPLADAGVPYRVVLMDGSAVLAIVQEAEKENADLIVTGRRGRGGFAELVLGSTSHALTHHAARPLVIVP